MKLLVLLPNLGSYEFFIFSVFWVNFLDNIFSSKFPIKLSNESSCNILVFYKGRLQNKSSIVVEKTFNPLGSL